MDSDTQTRLAQRQDPQLAARVVRNIGQLESDYLFAWGPLSERLLRDATAAVRKVAPEPWNVIGTEEELTITFPAWRATRGAGQDVWFELADSVWDEDDHCWAAVMVSAGPTKLCLELKFRKGLTPVAESLGQKDKLISNVVKLGFEYDGESRRLFVPITIDAEALAKGLELNDLDEALAPLCRAVEKAIASKADLDALIQHVREKGR